MFIMRKLFLLLIFSLVALNVEGAGPYYVRTNGSTNTNCTGLADADYDGSGTGEACAFNHPAWALPTVANSTESEATVLAAGETLVIVNGSYRIGCTDATDCVDATYNSNTGDCNTSASYDCNPRPVADNVTIIGCSTSGCGCTYGWGGQVTCTTTRPELYGAGNTKEIIDVSGSTGVTIKDLELTDRANCNAFSIFTCRSGGDMSNPSSISAQWAINAASATNLTITGVNMHGVGYEVMRVNNVNGMTITGSNLDYGTTGMNNDTTGTCETCGLSGTITIDKSSANWNGCIEDWENDGSIVANTCCSQAHGCSSADAIGFNNTGGTWVITDSDMSYNTADGPDLLYLNRGSYSGGSLTIKRSRMEGNAGNSTKGPNAIYVEDSFLIANCGFFQDQAFTYSNSDFDHCRSNTGSPIAIEFKSGDSTTPEFYNNTITSNGDITILTSGTCTSGIDVIAQGNIFLGGVQWNDDNENPLVGTGGDGYTDLWYEDGGTCNPDFVEDYNTIVGLFKETDWSGANTVVEATLSDVFSGTALQGPYTTPGYFQSTDYHEVLYLNATSSALGVSNEVGDDANDFNTYARGAAWDGGAVEYGSTPSGGGGGSSTTGKTISGALRINGGLRL